jgi:hypothetical protein
MADVEGCAVSAAPARRHLSLVDSETGEIVESRELTELQARVEKLAGDLKAAEKDLRAKRRIITELQRDKALERIEHPRYEDAVRVAKYWWRKCKASNQRVNYRTPDRLDAVLALMDIEEIEVNEETGKRERRPHYTLGDFKAAVDGAWFDPFITTHKNGKQERHNDLTQICRDSTRFDRFIAKSPTPVQPVDTDRDQSTLTGEGSKVAASSAAHRHVEVHHGSEQSRHGRTLRGWREPGRDWPVRRYQHGVGPPAP